MAKQGFQDAHWLDPDGNPDGGVSFGTGFTISWQRGPLGKEGTPGRTPPNGAFVEDVIDAAKARIEAYQASKFNCEENARALQHLEAALEALDSRTQRRVADGTEGTHESN